MRPLTRIIVHCSDTPPHMDIGVNEIRQWHLSRGWSDIGYHFVIRRSGETEVGRPVELPGAHTAGHNHDSIGICLVGGADARVKGRTDSNFTFMQYQSLVILVNRLEQAYGALTIHGHRDYAAKVCPCFNAASLMGRTNERKQQP